jgi:hypothetical protein
MAALERRNYVQSENLSDQRQAVETDTLPRDGLGFPDNVAFYFEHLNQLGLAGIFQAGNQVPLFDASGKQNGVRVISKYRLTDLGLRFVRACIGA